MKSTPEQFRKCISNKIDIDEESKCWNWKGAIDRGGYGRISFFGRNTPLHRVCYWAFKDNSFKIVENSFELVMHSCDNRRCCNPEHLSVGTYTENNHDRFIKENGRIFDSFDKKESSKLVSRKYRKRKKAALLISRINLELKF